MTIDPQTPNAHLTLISADRKNWTETENNNIKILDALIGSYFIVQNLQGIWQNATAYTAGMCTVDTDTSVVWQAQVAHTSALLPITFAEERAANPTYWTVFSSPARARGAWLPDTVYALNDFVVAGPQYAIAIQAHTSGSSFATDRDAGKWSILVDLSSAGSQVLPVPGGSVDANKFVTTTSDGNGYTIQAVAAVLTLLGATSIGSALFTAASATAARTTIDAQVAGSYQPLSVNLNTFAAIAATAFGQGLLVLANAAALRTAAGLGSSATHAATDFAAASDMTATKGARTAYVTVFGGVATLQKANGIASVTRGALGRLDVVFSSAMADLLFTVIAMSGSSGAGAFNVFEGIAIPRTTTTVSLIFDSGGAATDPEVANILILP